MSEPLHDELNEFDARTENELKKIKLSLEHGMDLTQSFASPDLPPETEGLFLDYIQKWEEQFAQRKTITVYELAGKPSFRPVGEVPEADISKVLTEMQDLLNKHSINLETLCEVNDRELYRFITEELLHEETEDIQIEGMRHCFIYEEFHPNHPYDIKNRCTEIMEHLASEMGDMTVTQWALADEITIDGQVCAKEAYNEHIVRFQGLFNSITLNQFSFESVTVNEAGDEASAIALVHYTVTTDDNQAMELKGNIIFNLTCQHEWWTIHEMNTPWKIAV